MPPADVVLIALALSIDAFAVCLAAAATGRVTGPRAVFRLAFHFGLFQFLMPVLGWAAGVGLEPFIRSSAHWVAAGLLGLVGLHMLRAGSGSGPLARSADPSRGLTLVALSTAVSLDALAVGLSLAMLEVSIWAPGVIIGVVAALASLAGLGLGGRFSARFGRAAEVAGALILFAIALRILASHLA